MSDVTTSDLIEQSKEVQLKQDTSTSINQAAAAGHDNAVAAWNKLHDLLIELAEKNRDSEAFQTSKFGHQYTGSEGEVHRYYVKIKSIGGSKISEVTSRDMMNALGYIARRLTEEYGDNWILNEAGQFVRRDSQNGNPVIANIYLIHTEELYVGLEEI